MNPILFLFLAFQAAQIQGTVYDPSGRPVPGAQVVCGPETRNTDAAGSFEVSSACEATITKSGFEPAKAQLPADYASGSPSE